MEINFLQMKNRYYSLATGAIALLLTSCSADEPVTQNATDGLISYNLVTSNQTRALHSYGTTDHPTEFRVWARHSLEKQNATQPYIDGDLIKSTDGGKTYFDNDGDRYWPEGGTLSFYAIADGDYTLSEGQKPTLFYGDDNASLYPAGKPKVTGYQIKDNATDQLDLMYAVAKDVSHSITGEVNLNFRHALSQVCFKAKNENNNVTITIKSITVKNVISKGDYLLPDATTTFGSTDATTHGEWKLSNVEADKKNYTINCGDNGIQLSSDATDLTNIANGIGNILNLLPQKVGTNDDISLDIELVAKNSDGTQIFPKPSENKDYGIINLPLYAEWEEGNRYTYTLNFTLNDLTKVTYNVTTDDYTSQERPIINGHEAVLMRKKTDSEPALYFATTNIGANSCEDFGLYFWWGDVNGNPQDNPSDFDYFSAPTKGLTFEQLFQENYITKADETGILTPEHDAAHIYWGSTWRMPTYEDLLWLKNNCTWEWQETPVKGYKVTSNYTHESIFLPAARCIEGTKFDSRGLWDNTCFYWSSKPSLNEDKANAYRLKVKKDEPINVSDLGKRTDGFPIRAVANSTK